MEYFCLKSFPEPDISVKREIEFDIKNEPEYDTIGSDNMPESEVETEVQIKNEPEAEIETKMELETDLKSEIEFGIGTKAAYNFLVRILIVCYLNLHKN